MPDSILLIGEVVTMKIEKALFVGVPKGKKCHDKALCVNITETFNKMMDIIPDIEKVSKIIGEHKSFKKYRPSRIFINYEQNELLSLLTTVRSAQTLNVSQAASV
jgi:hypothetical protein